MEELLERFGFIVVALVFWIGSAVLQALKRRRGAQDAAGRQRRSVDERDDLELESDGDLEARTEAQLEAERLARQRHIEELRRRALLEAAAAPKASAPKSAGRRPAPGPAPVPTRLPTPPRESTAAATVGPAKPPAPRRSKSTRPQQRLRALVRNPSDARRAILLATLLGPCPGASPSAPTPPPGSFPAAGGVRAKFGADAP